MRDHTQVLTSHPKDGGKASPQDGAGKYSLAEILSQPQCWSACQQELRRSGILSQIRKRYADLDSYLFIGCGSSYYVALSAAASAATLKGCRARAIPASELFLYPDATLAGADKFLPILISRSGKTSEVIEAANFLKSKNYPTLAISCAPGQPLEKIVDSTILLAPADEQSTVMTRSFSSMLLALQEFSAADGSDFGASLGKMPGEVAPLLKTLPEKISEFTRTHHFADYVCLGQGPLYGLACEYALKLTEMSLSYAQSFHTLEFRHGPKSIVGPETLLIFLLSETSYEAEREVLEEMKALGATTFVVTNEADGRVRAVADFLVELSLTVPELAGVAPYLFAGQLLGLHTGLHKGLDPDSPRNLSRVVMLNEPAAIGKERS